ncbi:hypothetical protein CE91St44_09930 [Oscillospiraceae bacterium]|uniref:pilus assembly FimT family protein n=1 Tax=Allofournierella sp. TaxID=1940256 RepID=UPI002089FABF|nr:hypothetical protein CE91St44_09930 [Oscillospiraceae bacterium]
MKLRSRTRPGFTLVEMIVVIVMMSILAAAGLIGFGAMVSHFREQACYASRREAAQEFVSEWLAGELGMNTADPSTIEINDWLKKYLAENQTEDGQNWRCRVRKIPGEESAEIWIWCERHRDLDLSKVDDEGHYSGDVWMKMHYPELIE